MGRAATPKRNKTHVITGWGGEARGSIKCAQFGICACVVVVEARCREGTRHMVRWLSELKETDVQAAAFLCVSGVEGARSISIDD